MKLDSPRNFNSNNNQTLLFLYFDLAKHFKSHKINLELFEKSFLQPTLGTAGLLCAKQWTTHSEYSLAAAHYLKPAPSIPQQIFILTFPKKNFLYVNIRATTFQKAEATRNKIVARGQHPLRLLHIVSQQNSTIIKKGKKTKTLCYKSDKRQLLSGFHLITYLSAIKTSSGSVGGEMTFCISSCRVYAPVSVFYGEE